MVNWTTRRKARWHTLVELTRVLATAQHSVVELTPLLMLVQKMIMVLTNLLEMFNDRLKKHPALKLNINCLALEIQDISGPPLQDNVAKLINNNLKRDFRRVTGRSVDDNPQAAVIVNKLKSVPVPENVPDLKSCKSNDCVHKALSMSQKRENSDLMVIESAICKAVVTQGEVMGKLVNLKKNLDSSFTDQFNDIFKSMASSFEFDIFARSRLNDYRRSRVLAGLNSSYAHLGNTTKPGDGLLFGNDIESAIRNVDVTNRLSNKLSVSARDSSSRPFLGRGRGRGRPPYRGRGYHHQTHRQPYRQHSQEGLPPPLKKARYVGLLKDNLKVWQEISDDSFILSCIEGYKLEFLSLPVQKFLPPVLKFNETEFKEIDAEIGRLLDIGAIVPCSHEIGEFVSNIFSRKKSNGKVRVILNLKPLNQFLVYEHFKMEHIDFVSDLVQEGDWFCSVDLSDAYFAVSIHDDFCKYLKFVWNGSLYMYKVMVFGLASAPRIFTRICKPILATLRGRHKIRCSLYIDDMVLCNSSCSDIQNDVEIVIDMFSKLGFSVNLSKSVLEPCQVIRHLGILIDSVHMTLGLPGDKLMSIDEKCRGLLLDHEKKLPVKIRSVASLIGTLVAAFPGTKYGRLFYRNLDRDKCIALKQSHGNYDALMSISRGIPDIQWWLTTGKLESFQIIRSSVDVTIYSDASLKGWGAMFEHLNTGGRWNALESTHHINWLELKACFFGLQAFLSTRKSIHIQAKLDNTCAISYINNQGGIIQELNGLASEIWSWCISRDIWLSAVHIPGTENVIADKRSRVFKDNTEWSLSEKLFVHVVETFGMPDVDLFASGLNHKVRKYVSWEADPNAFAVDAFALNWTTLGLCYAFPPFNMIGKILAKIKR